MELNKCLSMAEKAAEKAKPWILKHSGKVYTAVFNQKEWVYDVFEDGMFYLKVNSKSPNKAKQFLQQWLSN